MTFYFKTINGKDFPISNADNADFIRVILPPQQGENDPSIKEYYKDGKIKLISKTDYKYFSSFSEPNMMLYDDFISFYPTGRKKDVGKHDSTPLSFDEYQYFPNGTLYSYTKYTTRYNSKFTNQYIECRDTTGAVICENGNGKWNTYDYAFKNVLLSGAIEKGVQEGEWSGSETHYDTIKYSYKYVYKHGKRLSSTGFDKSGREYPFMYETVMAKYKEGAINFLDLFVDHIKTPRDANGKKMSLDSIYVSFIVEKDGRLTNLQSIGNVDPLLKEALATALAKSPNWTPTKFWGIPLRTKVIFPLNDFKATDSPNRSMLFRIEPIER